MAVYIFATDGSGIAAFDLLESETHSETSQATEHNVEDGSPITDHVVIESSTLSLSLGVTNTPTGPDPDQFRGAIGTVELFTPTWQAPFDGTPGAIFRGLGEVLGGPQAQSTTTQVMQFVPAFNRIAEVEQLLLDFKNGAKLVSYASASRSYEDMVIEHCELRNEKHGMAMFALDLRQIRFVKTATVSAPKPLEPRGTPLKKAGQQAPATTPSDDVRLHKSDLLGLINRVVGAGN